MNIPQVAPAQAKDFGKHWKTPGGLHIFIDEQHYAFAAAFANVVLKSFVEDAQKAAAAVAKARQIQVVQS